MSSLSLVTCGHFYNNLLTNIFIDILEKNNNKKLWYMLTFLKQHEHTDHISKCISTSITVSINMIYIAVLDPVAYMFVFLEVYVLCVNVCAGLSL